ncbi:hypothetical protein PY479_12515 [Shewanella sp. A32]|uniref:hypothetical protein n=1 Tax=Shewanella sp. A32 TaxID=3031327 RepID=UPI0023B90E75|nr:hypothetical protein [Shewanella sp. A32]MDF0535095.1 hypothetical protein [Shewanella sp. A32]
MKACLVVCGLLLCSTPAFANGNSSLNSELGHFAGGVFTSSAVTALSNYIAPEQNRAWNGFWVPTAVSSLEELREFAVGDNTAGEALLDASCFAVGAFIGSYSTNHFLLTPTVGKDGETGRYFGLNLAFRF